MGIDPKLLGSELGKIVRETIDREMARVTDLEQRIDGMQNKLDHLSQHAMTYAGEYQRALPYKPGQVVRVADRLFVALKNVKPSTADPAREGSYWERIV